MRVATGFVKRGIIARCPGLRLPIKGRLARLTRTPAQVRVLLTCDLDCNYRAGLQRLPAGTTIRTLSGRAGGRRSTWVRFLPPTAPGSYRITAKLVHPVNPGDEIEVASGTFRVRAA
jgi:hypothetical protein